MTKKQQLILKIMHLAYLVHELTEFCVFMRLSGHIGSVEISIRESREKWENVMLESRISKLYAENRKEMDPTFSYLTAKVEVLEHILQEQEIPYEKLDYEEEYIRHYSF